MNHEDTTKHEDRQGLGLKPETQSKLQKSEGSGVYYFLMFNPRVSAFICG